MFTESLNIILERYGDDPYISVPAAYTSLPRGFIRLASFEDLPLGGADYGDVIKLEALIGDAMDNVLSHEWLFGSDSPFLESDFRQPVEYVPYFNQEDITDPKQVANLQQVACGLRDLLQAFDPNARSTNKSRRFLLQTQEKRDQAALARTRLITEVNEYLARFRR